MIDTIHLLYQIKDMVEYEMLKKTLNRLRISSSYKRYDRLYYKAHLRNLELGLSPQALKIRGSLPKFYLGNNIQTLTPEQIKWSLFQLSDLLQINVFSAEVRRIDIAHCFFLGRPVAHYLDCLEETPEFRKYYRVAAQTKSFIKENYSIVFYDKKEEAKKDDERISPQYSSSNILRVELQLRKRLAAELQFEEIQAVRLLARGFLAKLVERWYPTDGAHS